MAQPDRVSAHLLQQLQPPLPHAFRYSRTGASAIAVDTDAVHLDVFPTGCFTIALIQSASLNFNLGSLGSNRWSGNERAPLGNVNWIGSDEPHVPVDAGSGVPTAVRLQRVVYADPTWLGLPEG